MQLFANPRSHLALLLMVLMLVISACGSSAPSTPASTAPSAAGEASAATEPSSEPEAASAAASEAGAESAAAAPATDSGAAAGGEIVFGMAGTFDKVDPNATTFSRVGSIAMQIVDPLIWQPEIGTFEPGLATEWSVNDDATEYTFKLRDDVTFHDGTPFNAEAVKFTFDRIVDPETKAQSALSLIGPYDSSEVVSDYEIKVIFKAPYAAFLNSASSSYLAPISPTAFERVGAEDWGITEVVATGPFKLESYVPDSEVVLVRNEDYNWAPAFAGVNGPARIERITYRIISEPATRIASLETGESTFVDEVPEIDYARIDESDDFVTVAVSQPGSGHSLMMNQEQKPMDELAVRRAIQLASDKAGMIATIWNGIGEVGCGPITHATFAFDEATCSQYTYDPEAAKQVLEEAGWVDSDGDGIREKDGQKLSIGHYYRADAVVNSQMADYMKADLAKVGIEVQLNGLAQAGYFDAVRSGKHHTQNWWDTGSDPDVVRVLFYSGNAGGGTNRNNYRSEEMDQLIDQAAGEADPDARVELYKQLQQKVMDDALMVFYNDPMTLYAHSPTLQNPYMYLGGTAVYFYPASVSQ